MNVPAGFLEKKRKLALGLELIDAFRWRRMASMVVAFDKVPGVLPRHRRKETLPGEEPEDDLVRLPRHDSGLFSLLEDHKLKDPVVLRVFDPSRQYVPRRIEIDLDPNGPAIVRPHFFPGSAYDVSSRSTGVFGLVVRGTPERPVRWARVEARLSAAAPLAGRLIGRAMADDRGEFLLLFQSEASTIGPLVTPLSVELTALGPLPTPPVPARPDLPDLDPYWDVPVEHIPAAAGPAHSVLTGATPPSGFGSTPTSTITVSCPLGRLRGVPKIVLDQG